MTIRPLGAELFHADGQANRYMKLILGSRNFANSPKMCAYEKYFEQCYRAHYVIKMLNVWSWQWRYLRLFVRKTHTQIYTQYMYNSVLYTYINICTYTHQRWKKLHALCSWSDYGTGLTYVWQRVWSTHNPNIILRTSCSNAYKRYWSVRWKGKTRGVFEQSVFLSRSLSWLLLWGF